MREIKFKNNSVSQESRSISFFGIFTALIIVFVFISKSIFGSLICTLILGLELLFFWKYAVISIYFINEEIYCKYLFGNKKKISFSSVQDIHQKKGRQDNCVHFIKWKTQDGKIKELSLYATDEKYQELRKQYQGRIKFNTYTKRNR